nr:hypothetical protein [uncultured Prevotella sp.]
MPWGTVKEAESEAKNVNAKAEKDKMRAAGDEYGQMVCSGCWKVAN